MSTENVRLQHRADDFDGDTCSIAKALRITEELTQDQVFLLLGLEPYRIVSLHSDYAGGCACQLVVCSPDSTGYCRPAITFCKEC